MIQHNRKLFSLLALLFLGNLFLYAQHGTRKFTIEDITQFQFSCKRAGIGFRPYENDSYTTISRDGSRIERYSFATGKLESVLLDLSDVEAGHNLYAIEDYSIAPGGKEILILTDVNYIYRRSWNAYAYRYDVDSKKLYPVREDTEKISNPTFSPNGKMLAYVCNNNVYINNFENNSTTAVTTDGLFNKVINGATDWVYEEEFGVTNTLTWSPDASYLSFVRFDESKVNEYGFQIYSPDNYPQLPCYQYKYPTAGTKNSEVSVIVYNVGGKTSQKVSLPITPEHYIPHIAFTQRDNALGVYTLNRHQNHFSLFLVNPVDRSSKVVLSDSDKAYINNEWINSLVVLKDGFVMVSDKNGYAQIFRYDKNGKELKCLTPGKYDVTKLYGVDDKGNVYYQAADQTPIQRRVFKVSPEGKITLLAGERGINDATFTKDYSYFILQRSNSEQPYIYTVNSTVNGKAIRVLEDNAALKAKLENYSFQPREFTTLKLSTGVTVNAYLLKPPHMDPTKKYPVLMVQYSGPDSQEVLDKFDIDWVYYLAQEGYIVACVDGRGTGARGREWRKCTYQKLGIYESDDQIAAAKALGQLPYVDAKRIGIWGWSFGGYNTLLCLCRGDVFKLGIAVAPVTDFRFYDTIYAERYLRTPQENPDGYYNGAPLSLAQNMHGKLLIIHGTADDNVHVRNTMLFTEKLVQADIPFEMALYTNRNHSIYGGNTRTHLYKRMFEFLKRNL